MYSQISFSDHSSNGLTLCRPYWPSHSTGAAAGDGAAKRLHLANAATPVALFETVAEPVDAVLPDPVLQIRSLGIVDGQGPPVALLYPFDEIIGLGVQPPGIDAEDLDLRHRPPDKIGEDDGFGT